MGRWLAAIVVLGCAVAAALVVFQNGGAAVPIRLTPSDRKSVV